MLDLSIKVKLKDVNDKFPLPGIKIETCNLVDTNFYFNNIERKVLNEVKNKIDENNLSKDWDKNKKVSNLYELIHISNNKMKDESISRYDPLSRSFFKMWELINHFGLINNPDQSIVSGHLAEGPGGFIEACLYYRHRMLKINPLLDKYYGITLNPYNKEIPGWIKANSLIKQFKKNIDIDYGIDNTGDLYKVCNIRSFSRKINNQHSGADLITADGGFDFSVDFNKQEQLSHRLILAEIITGIRSQKLYGSFICKIYDSYSYITVQLLYFISCLYGEVYLAKPLTSRPANSEKYIVALNYNGFNSYLEEQYYINQLENILNIWDDVKDKGLIFNSFFENPPSYFLNRIMEYNCKSYQEQSKYINKTIDIINKKPGWKELDIIFKEQTIKAVNWCQYYNIPINLDSYFYQKYYSDIFTKKIEDLDIFLTTRSNLYET